MNIGVFTISAPLGTGRIRGETASGAFAAGSAAYFEVQGPEGLHLGVRDISWENGERDIVTFARHSSPQIYDTLVERLRLSVLVRGGVYVELRQARVRANGHAGLFDASLAALSRGAGVDVPGILRQFGATAVGTRSEILGDTGRSRHRIGACLAAGPGSSPLVAYVLTRIAPVAHGITA